ncbi:MAG: hypothetical protein JW829_16090, partial [Pirellulales bacterium]|nr:hypothetical protein [Pirellulales bacterium]
DFWYDWSPSLHSHVGYAVDDPIDRDLMYGRSYNHVLFGNLSRNLTEKFVVGVEVSYAETSYRETGRNLPTPAPGESVMIEFMGMYGF